MRAMQLSMMILCITLAGAVIDFWGGFSDADGIGPDGGKLADYSSADISKIEATTQNTSVRPASIWDSMKQAANDLVGLNLSVATTEEQNIKGAEETAGDVSGWEMIQRTYSSLMGMFANLAYPYGYLYRHGVPSVIAASVQVLFNAVLLVALIQFLRGTGFAGFK